MVEKLFPTFVFLVAYAHGEDGVMFGFDWFAFELHGGLARCASTFLGIAFNTATDEVCPRGAAALRTRDDVIERKFGGRKFAATVLAAVVITSKDITAVEFDILTGNAVVT